MTPAFGSVPAVPVEGAGRSGPNSPAVHSVVLGVKKFLYCRALGPEGIQRELSPVYQEANRFLASLGVDYWLAFGTLLGWYRDGGLIRNDSDVDFGLSERDAARVWESRGHLSAGYTMEDTTHAHPGPKLSLRRDGWFHRWKVDLYFYRDVGDDLQCCLTSEYPPDTLPFPRSWIFPLQRTTFLGQETLVPGQPEAWLRHTYGYLGRDAVRDRSTGLFRPRGG